MRSVVMTTTASIAALLLAGCGSKESGQQSADAMTGGQKVEAIASTLQACSYDGKPVNAAADTLNGSAPGECSTAVGRIMGFTGLPANFTVVSGPVDNAAAVILLDQNKVPRRVIAFNPQFMQAAQQLAGGSPWGPISVMAHEIAHHLSGHTITPGGSRPEIELEADKFSGYVLQKMGAPLAGATQMILAVGTDHATPTHPDKRQRASAIQEGWVQSCQQGGGMDCGNGQVSAPSAGQSLPVPSPSATFGGPAVPNSPVLTPAVATRTAPLPAPGSIPFKYGRFIADETGKLDPVRMRAIDQQLYTLARDVGVEFAMLVVNDLRGMSAQDFAWAMMRQLRVGKLDVGNGAVVVVAPRQRQAAVAFGPGLAKEAEFSKPDQQLLQWIDAAWNYCDDADGCKQWTDNLFEIFRGTLFNAKNTQWTIRFQTLGDLVQHYERQEQERMRTKRPFDDKVDQPIGNLIRVSGTITSLSPPVGIGQANQGILNGPLGYRAVSMTTDDGYPMILYVSPRMTNLMPAGQIKADTRYTVVGRVQTRGDKKQQASGMWLFSYDEL